MNTQNSPFSPKNKFHFRFQYDKPIEGIGSASSFGTMSIEDIDQSPQYQERANRGSGIVTAMENRKNYPEYDWHILYRKRF